MHSNDNRNILSLKSLKAQTYPLHQIIISDNANGGFKTLAKEYGCDYVYTDKASRSIARNAGFNLVTGDLTVFIDEDMILTKNCIQYFVDWYLVLGNRYTTVNGFVNDFILPIDVSCLTDDAFKKIIDLSQDNNYVKMKAWRYPSNIFCGLTKVLKRYVEKTGLFDENFKGYGEEDTELFYRMYTDDVRMVYCNGALAFHRRHEVDYEGHKEAARKNIMYFLNKHDYKEEIIETSKENWKSCYKIDVDSLKQLNVI
jgi:glycosyltransferase involved in cell wall biosynthesis